jgi:hypothetical protein
MSSYFESFPKSFYNFGNETTPVLFQKLTKYVDFIDTFRDDIGTYLDYEILDGDRPDTLSHKLYGRSDYDWTFFVMNPRLRETGWPLSVRDVYEKATTTYFRNYTAKLDVSTAEDVAQYADIYPVGTPVAVGGQAAVVVKKDLQVGEIVLSSDFDIRMNVSMEYTTPTSDPLTVNAPLTNVVYEYEGTHHYVNGDEERVDYFFDAGTRVPITNLEHLVNENEESKRIRVIKRDLIQDVVGKYKRLLSANN